MVIWPFLCYIPYHIMLSSVLQNTLCLSYYDLLIINTMVLDLGWLCPYPLSHVLWLCVIRFLLLRLMCCLEGSCIWNLFCGSEAWKRERERESVCVRESWKGGNLLGECLEKWVKGERGALGYRDEERRGDGHIREALGRGGSGPRKVQEREWLMNREDLQMK